MVAKATEVLFQMRWILDDSRSISFMLDPWIADLPLIRWPTFISMDISDSILISDLLLVDGR